VPNANVVIDLSHFNGKVNLQRAASAGIVGAIHKATQGTAAVIPPNWPAYTLWQYTDGHHGNPPHAVDGIGACDRDLYEGTEDDLTTRWATGSLA